MCTERSHGASKESSSHVRQSIPALVVALGCAAIAQTLPVPAHAADGIVVLKSRESPQYNEAVNGFLQKWTVQDAALPVRQAVLGNPTDDPNMVFGTAARPAAIVAVGTDAARWAIKNTSGLVVFCMVANAQSSLGATMSAAEKARIHGVSLDIPAMAQLQTLGRYLTKAKRLGVIYDPRKSGAAVQEIEQAAARLGIQVVKQEVVNESILPDVTDGIASRVDALWAPVDSTVYNSRSAQFILAQMLQHNVPVMGFSESMVKAGALLACQVDYQAVGAQTAALLEALLKGNPAADDSIQAPRTYHTIINSRVQQVLGNPIPSSALREAKFVNED